MTNEYGGIWRQSTSSRDALAAIVMRFVDEYFSLLLASTRFRHIYLSRDDDDDVRDPKTRFSFGSTSLYVI